MLAIKTNEHFITYLKPGRNTAGTLDKKTTNTAFQ